MSLLESMAAGTFIPAIERLRDDDTIDDMHDHHVLETKIAWSLVMLLAQMVLHERQMAKQRAAEQNGDRAKVEAMRALLQQLDDDIPGVREVLEETA